MKNNSINHEMTMLLLFSMELLFIQYVVDHLEKLTCEGHIIRWKRIDSFI